MSCETSPTAHRKIDGIEINIKILLAIPFSDIRIIIIEVLMFAIIMRARR